MLDLRRQHQRLGALEPLVFLEADDHGRGGSVVSEDRPLAAVPGAADHLAEVLAGIADRHLAHAKNCTTWRASCDRRA
jgi:hypothetical protein